MNVRPSPLSRVPLAMVPWAAIALCVVLYGCVTADADWGTITETRTDPKTGEKVVTVNHKRGTHYMDNRTGAALGANLFGSILDNLTPGTLIGGGVGLLGLLGVGGKLLHTNAKLKGANAGYDEGVQAAAGKAPLLPNVQAAPAAVS